MKRVLSLIAIGSLLLSGAGEAWASSCDRPVRRHGYHGGHRFGDRHFRHGSWELIWQAGRDCWPARRYTKVIAPACPTPAYNTQTLVVNVRNGNGSYTPVTLRREGNVYVGPRGEQYLSVPTEEQLRSVYGLQ